MKDIQFIAVSGSDAFGDLPWIIDHPVRWRLTEQNGRKFVRVGTACGGFRAEVAVTKSQVTVDQGAMQISAIYCEPPLADYDRWVHQLIQEPLQYAWDGVNLNLSNSIGSLTLEAKN